MQPLEADTRTTLASALSSNASVGNPVDLVASAGPDAFEHAIVTAMNAVENDSVIVVYTPIDPTQTEGTLAAIARAVVKARTQGVHKPVLACTLSMAAQPAPLSAGIERIPAYVFPENAAAYARWRAEPPSLFWTFDDVQWQQARVPCQSVAAVRGDTWLTGGELARLLERSLVVQALERSGWNQTRAAPLLGLNRDQIRYRIEKFQLERPNPERV